MERMDTEEQAKPQLRHEAPDLGSAIARLIRALVERAETGDTEALEQLAALELLIPAATTLAGHLMLGYGYSHAELAAVLGISRQASVKRYGPVVTDPMVWGWFRKQHSAAAVMGGLVHRLASRRSS